MAITQTISNFPTAPNSQTDTPTEFNSHADSFVHHQADTYVTEVNTWATQANSLKSGINQIKTDIDNIVASIPAGTINDSLTGTDKVWSSTKVSSEIGLKADKAERGSNANGMYLKLPDGTLICYFSTLASATNVAKGALFGASQLDTWTFPFIFSTATHIGISGALVTNDGNAWISFGAVTTSSVSFQGLSYKTDGTQRYAKLMAVGRWK